jgi:hypothetical protein
MPIILPFLRLFSPSQGIHLLSHDVQHEATTEKGRGGAGGETTTQAFKLGYFSLTFILAPLSLHD